MSHKVVAAACRANSASHSFSLL